MRTPTLVGAIGGWGDARSGLQLSGESGPDFIMSASPREYGYLLNKRGSECQPVLSAINSAVVAVVGMSDDDGPSRSNAARPIYSTRADVCVCLDTA